MGPSNPVNNGRAVTDTPKDFGSSAGSAYWGTADAPRHMVCLAARLVVLGQEREGLHLREWGELSGHQICVWGHVLGERRGQGRAPG